MSDDLTLSDLPDPEDVDAVFEFARSFSGYDYFGSSQACAEEAKRQRRLTIPQLRNELFFYYRASNHLGVGRDFRNKYKELLPYFLRLLER